MTTSGDCGCGTDARRLVRDGTRQGERFPAELNPSFVLADEHGPVHRILYASTYAALLNYYDSTNSAAGNWQRFFDGDVSAQLAAAAVADVSEYRSTVTSLTGIISSRAPIATDTALTNALGCLFSTAGSLASAIDRLRLALPESHSLRATVGNLVLTQLGPALKRLIAYFKGGKSLAVVDDSLPSPPLRIMGVHARTFTSMLSEGLSPLWITDAAVTNWADYRDGVAEDSTPYGPSPASSSEHVNRLATHNQFTSAITTFLSGYARIVADASDALELSFHHTGHEPHYALFLAITKLLEHARSVGNTLTEKHLDFYYRQVLRLREKPPRPSRAHLLVTLAKPVQSHRIAPGTLFKAGKDATGTNAFFAANEEMIANKARVVALKSIYRHHNTTADTLESQDGRVFASSAADSDDGAGAPLSTVDGSWHPLFNKVFSDGVFSEIRMPLADMGFAVASNHLWLAEGDRTVTVDITAATPLPPMDLTADVTCLLTTAEGWCEAEVAEFAPAGNGRLRLAFALGGDAPSVSKYVSGTHGFAFDTDLPMMLVKLRHRSDAEWPYEQLEDVVVTRIDLTIIVDGLRTLALSNDFGPIDGSKAFQPYGPAPIPGSAFIVGSQEAFQKRLTSADLDIVWMEPPDPYSTDPHVEVDLLDAGRWEPVPVEARGVTATSYPLVGPAGLSGTDMADLTADEPFGTESRRGFVRLRLTDGFGQDAYTSALVNKVATETNTASKKAGMFDQIARVIDEAAEAEDNDLGTPIAQILALGSFPIVTPLTPPTIPTVRSASINYVATQSLMLEPLGERHEPGNGARFFHITPFGHAEQPTPNQGSRPVTLLPQFTCDNGARAEAELCVGIDGLHPPQNVALLAQVVDGSSNPLTVKPVRHITWSYLRQNVWVPLRPDSVSDATSGLVESGIVKLSIPADATADNTVLPAGLHWVRAVVEKASDAVCRLLMLSAGAVTATFDDKGNDPEFAAKALAPNTISKLAQPDAAVKAVEQPFPTFGGHGAESTTAFATRVSERLRHKDRGITLWDYERLVLEAFPSIHRARCLNHTRYEPNPDGTGIYRELAPGHVTVVTIPAQPTAERRNALQPMTSTGQLNQIERYLLSRISGFVRLHVRNPVFEEVYVDFRVRLRDGIDESFHITKLRDEITRFLSPWAFSDADLPTFGGKFYKSVLIDFVEERSYVDYVTDFRLHHRYRDRSGSGGETEVTSGDSEVVVGSSAIAILVSVPARQHVISTIRPGEEPAPTHDCPCGVQPT